MIEIESLAELEREVFGPVLHVLRYARESLPALLEQIRDTGYGLTMGVHTRVDETVAQVVRAAHAGNVYVNRNIVGAVVGVQPFGGEGLSGTGPKAGGPLYLLRLLAAHPRDAARCAVQGAGAVAPLPIRGLGDDSTGAPAEAALRSLERWAHARGRADLAAGCERVARASPVTPWRTLAGPTGESNLYAVQPRDAVLCLAGDDADRLLQLAAVLAVGSRAVWPADAQTLAQALPADVREHVVLAQDWAGPGVHVDAALHAGRPEAAAEVAVRLAARPGPIVGLARWPLDDDAAPLERLVVERSLSINTAAAGGNASLMTIG